jgi:hypothetical protein
MQLHATDVGQFGGIANFFWVFIDEHADRARCLRQCLDDSPNRIWGNVSRALAVKIEADHVRSKLHACSRVARVGNTTDLDQDCTHN